MRLPRLVTRRFLTFVAALTLVLVVTSFILPPDHAFRSFFRFNGGRLSSFFSTSSDTNWIWKPMQYPVAFTTDVGLVIKTGYGTKNRIQAQMEAMSLNGKKRDIIIVGDFKASLDGIWTTVEVIDVVGRVLEEDTLSGLEDTPRALKYKELKEAIDAGQIVKAAEIGKRVGWQLDAMKFIPGLELAYQRAPEKKWWVIMDDDTFLIKPSVEKILSRLDPEEDHYIGNAIGDYKGRFAHGGSAIALSKRTMQHLFERRDIVLDAKVQSVVEIMGDKLLAMTLMKIGVYVDERFTPHFNGERPKMTKITAENFCLPIVSFHGLDYSERMLAAGKMFKKKFKPVFWGQLWGLFGQPDMGMFLENPVRPEWNYVGRLDESTRTIEQVASFEDCLKECDARSKCLAWTWEQGSNKCHFAPWVVVGDEAKGMYSGLHFERAQKIGDRCGEMMKEAGCYTPGSDCAIWE